MQKYKNGKQEYENENIENMLIVSTCLAVESSISPLAVTFITSKCILTANSIINTRVVETFVDICKIKWGNFVCPYPKTRVKGREKLFV